MIDRLFDHQSEWAFAANPLFHLKEQAVGAGLSEAEFDACLKNQALFDKVKAKRDDAATKLKVSSTPTFFVDGDELNGEHALEKIDELLGQGQVSVSHSFLARAGLIAPRRYGR